MTSLLMQPRHRKILSWMREASPTIRHGISVTGGSGDEYNLWRRESKLHLDCDYINAGDGDNSVIGGSGQDDIVAGSGNDYLDGGSYADTISAGGG
jgi:Ca2+-binding RTX toxin-like protein